MPRSAGNYTLPSGNPVVTGTQINSTTHNSTMSDIATELTNSLPRDGTAPPLANIPMGTNKFTGLGAGSALTDSANYTQIQNQAYAWLTGVAGTNTITASVAPAMTAYAAGQTFRFVAAGANTGAVTLNINSLGAKAVTQTGTVVMGGGEFVSGAVIEVTYDGTRFQVTGMYLSATDLQEQAFTAFTTGGTSTAFTLTPSPALASLVTGSRFNVTFNAAAGTTPTLAVSGLTAKNLKYYDTTGAKQAVTSSQVPNGWVSDVFYDGTDWVVLSIPPTNTTDKIQPITASVAANAMTVTLNPTTLDFRSATLGSGTVTTRIIGSAISVVIPSGATLGTTSAVANRVAVLAIDNSGTIELAVCNAAGTVKLDESTLISTTVIDTGSDSSTVIYSTTARTNVPYRVVGFVESTQATAGTWATSPSTIQGFGGTVKIFDNIQSGISVTASGTSVDFVGIPSSVKRITIPVSALSTNGTSIPIIQIGSGSVLTTGYDSMASGTSGGTLGSIQFTNGFGIVDAMDAAYSHSGAFVLIHAGGNLWTMYGVTRRQSAGVGVAICGGAVSLAGALDRVRITTVLGADTFDAGTINILYE